MESQSTSTPNAPTLESSQADTDYVFVSDELEVNSDGDEVLPSGKLRSEVWKYFQRVRVKGVGSVKARCIYCKKKLVGDAKSGTTHLKEHFKGCTRRKLVESKQKVLTASVLMGEGKRKLEAYTFDQEFARRQLACMIIMHEYPLSIVEHVGFRRFVQSLQPLFHVVSRNTIKNDILKIYDVERVKTMKVLQRNQSRISMTTDMWTATNQKRGFMVITAHFIDDSWKLQSRIIRFVYVPCPHTAEVLCEVLMDTFLEWNLDRKLSTLTVDNCTTNDAMVSLLLDKLGSDSHAWCNSLFHVRCSAHILNLIVKDGLDIIKSSIEKVRESVAYWTATPKREEKFESVARQLLIKNGKKLSLDCPTRWNSTFLMLQTALEYKDIFCRLKLRENAFKCCPDDYDWVLATDICGRLEIFYKVTELFSGTKYPTSNLFFAEVCKIKLELSKWVVSGIDVVVNMASKMIEKYEKYWDNIHDILGVAAVLDPRYKMTLIEFYFTRIYGEDASFRMERVRKLCYDLLTMYQDKNRKCDESSSKEAFTFGGEDLSDYDLFVFQQKKGKISHVQSELDHYLEEDVLPPCSEFDILGWWKSNVLKYPTLQAIARDVLAIPVSTVASESCFSTGGRVVSPNRNRLHPKTLEALMCAQSWLFALEYGGELMMSENRFTTINDEEDMDIDDSVADVTSLDD